MASNGGCGGCGGADRQDDENVAQVGHIMNDEEAADLLMAINKPITRPSKEETVAVQEEAKKYMTPGLLNEDEAKLAAAIAAAIVMAVQLMLSNKLRDELTVDSSSIASDEPTELPKQPPQGLPKFGIQNVLGVVERCFVKQDRLTAYCTAAGVVQGEGQDVVTASVSRSLPAIATICAVLEKLGMVKGDGVIEGNALGMHKAYHILDMPFWTQLLKTACGEGRAVNNPVFVFAALSTLYANWKILGYKPAVDHVQRQDAQSMAQGNSKQYHAMLRENFVYNQDLERNNIPRLTDKREQTGEIGVKRTIEKKPKKQKVSDQDNDDRGASKRQKTTDGGASQGSERSQKTTDGGASQGSKRSKTPPMPGS